MYSYPNLLPTWSFVGVTVLNTLLQLNFICTMIYLTKIFVSFSVVELFLQVLDFDFKVKLCLKEQY